MAAAAEAAAVAVTEAAAAAAATVVAVHPGALAAGAKRNYSPIALTKADHHGRVRQGRPGQLMLGLQRQFGSQRLLDVFKKLQWKFTACTGDAPLRARYA
jgi:hypothetical protein